MHTCTKDPLHPPTEKEIKRLANVWLEERMEMKSGGTKENEGGGKEEGK